MFFPLDDGDPPCRRGRGQYPLHRAGKPGDPQTRNEKKSTKAQTEAIRKTPKPSAGEGRGEFNISDASGSDSCRVEGTSVACATFAITSAPAQGVSRCSVCIQSQGHQPGHQKFPKASVCMHIMREAPGGSGHELDERCIRLCLLVTTSAAEGSAGDLNVSQESKMQSGSEADITVSAT